MNDLAIQVLILAAGIQARWETDRNRPKQLLLIGNETIITRIIRQCRNRGVEPLVITQNEAIQQAVDAECVNPPACRWTVETLQNSPWGPPPWGDGRTIVLLGDVVYSRNLMDTIFRGGPSIVVHGHLYEIFAVTFSRAAHQRVGDALYQAIEHAEAGGTGKLRTLYQALRGIPLDDDSIEGELLKCVDYMVDYTRDVDTPRDYKELLNKVVKTGAINDE